MKLGISTYACTWNIGIAGYPLPAQPMDAEGLLRRADTLGVRLVQIADNLRLHELSNAQLDDVHALAGQLGIEIEVGARGIAPDHLRRYLALAQRLGSPILRVITDTATFHPDPAEVVTILRGALPDFERAGIKIAIENHDRFKVRTLVDILQQVNSPYVGICLDTANSLGVGEGLEVVVEALGPYVVNLHVKDFIIRRHPSKLGFEVQGMPVGQGMLDVPWLLSQLEGREFNSILELWTPPEATTEQSIAKENAWAAESIKVLRGLITG